MGGNDHYDLTNKIPEMKWEVGSATDKDREIPLRNTLCTYNA